MSSALNDIVEGKIDFEGQALVETLARNVLVGSTAVSFILGFAAQSLRVTFATLGASVVLLYLVVVPQWPWFRRHPIKWLPVKKDVKAA